MDWQPVKLEHSVDTKVAINPASLNEARWKQLAKAMGIDWYDQTRMLHLRGVIVDTFAHPDSEYQFAVQFEDIDDEFSFKTGELVEVKTIETKEVTNGAL